MPGERILFVDDEEQIRKLLATWLRRRGYEVTVAKDGWEALKAVRATLPDLVITDIQMPNMNGLELTRRLRGDHRTARLPIVMLSARKQADDVLTGYREGADEYIPKPVEMAILAAKIEMLLRRFEAGGAWSVKRGGKVVVFLHGKGGVGNTTLAVNAAVALAATTMYRVSLLDLNLEFGDAFMQFDLHPERTLADLSEKAPEDSDDAMFEKFVSTDQSGVRLVVGSDLPERGELVTVPAVQQTLDRLRRQSDYVIVDTPPSFSQQTLAAIDAAGTVCVVTSAHLPAMRAAKACLEVLDKLSFPKERTLLIVNRTSLRWIEGDQVARFFDRKPDVVIPHTPTFDDAADRGRPFTVLQPESSTAKVMRDLAAQITIAAPAGR